MKITLKQVLTEVNFLRKQYDANAPELTKLPKGYRQMATHCPIANSFKAIFPSVKVTVTTSAKEGKLDYWLCTDDGGMLMCFAWDSVIGTFIRTFDKGKYTSLIAEIDSFQKD